MRENVPPENPRGGELAATKDPAKAGSDGFPGRIPVGERVLGEVYWRQ